ncbi:MAG: hypothetical protein ACI8TQ_000994 [Planctomycetota bacterium]|jgi:hypothetical protein
MISQSKSTTMSVFTACVVSVVGTLSPLSAQDIVIPPGVTVVVDTTFSFLQSTTGELVKVTNGHVALESFVLGDGAVLELRGPNPFRMLARKQIDIFGRIDAKGYNAQDVKGVFTAMLPEPGAPGNLGSGAGGTASASQTSSTAAGGQGFQAFATTGGGHGGESGYGANPSSSSLSQVQNSNPKYRRGAGGGGGTFGPDATGSTAAGVSSKGLVAMPGGNGSTFAFGALGSPFPMGGAIGQSPFQDFDSENDYWGVRFDRATGQLVVGELPGLTAGAGGGGGGDSIRSFTFPNPNFSSATEDKGAGGGGGGGALHLRAIGRINMFNQLTGAQGSIHANGGDGGNGQLIQFLNNFFVRSGGGGGGGSGGHIVLESSTGIDLGVGAQILEARGGFGGQSTSPATVGFGGQGGPGVIQLHSPGGKHSIKSALPLKRVGVPDPKVLLPRHGLK